MDRWCKWFCNHVLLFRHPSYYDIDRISFCLCVGVHCSTCHLFVSVPVFEHKCVLVCVSVTNHCMIYSFFLWCCCLGPAVCHANAQRSLCNWSGPLEVPAIWTPAALDVCMSVRQFLLIAQSQDSERWLSIEWFLHRLNTSICNKVGDHMIPWPWYWPDNAELSWEQMCACYWL